LEVEFLANGEGGFPLWANRDSVRPAHWGGADAAARAIERAGGSFRSRLDQIINMKHALVRLGGQIDWRLIGDKLGEVYTDDPGQPPLPTRLMAGMAILKHMHNLSDDEVLLLLGPRRCRATL
jgi:hypothetical protein